MYADTYWHPEFSEMILSLFNGRKVLAKIHTASALSEVTSSTNAHAQYTRAHKLPSTLGFVHQIRANLNSAPKKYSIIWIARQLPTKNTFFSNILFFSFQMLNRCDTRSINLTKQFLRNIRYFLAHHCWFVSMIKSKRKAYSKQRQMEDLYIKNNSKCINGESVPVFWVSGVVPNAWLHVSFPSRCRSAHLPLLSAPLWRAGLKKSYIELYSGGRKESTQYWANG